MRFFDSWLTRRMMSGGGNAPSPSCPYVNNGLVCWFDGIDKGGTSGAWTDLIGGIVFTADGAVSGATGWTTGNGMKLINSDSLVFPYNSSTIEVAFTRQGLMSSGRQIDLVNLLDSGSISLSFDPNRVYVSRASVTGGGINCDLPASDETKPYCISAQLGRIIVNGSVYTGSRKDYVGAANYNTIGSRGNNNYYMTGIVHSVRIYNRKLTDAEMQQNQSVDNTRFNLGITL